MFLVLEGVNISKLIIRSSKSRHVNQIGTLSKSGWGRTINFLRGMQLNTHIKATNIIVDTLPRPCRSRFMIALAVRDQPG